MLDKLNRLTIVTGHYGSGKTNLSVNLALDIKAKGNDVVLVDLDIVNPYFRSADFVELMQKHDIQTINPIYANTNLDLPALSPQISAALDTDKHIIIDVGGDDAGAAALGRYAQQIKALDGHNMLYVVNCFRYLTRDAVDAVKILREIEAVSRLEATYIVNNSNLAGATSLADVSDSMAYAKKVCDIANLPLLFTSAKTDIGIELLRQKAEKIYPVEIYVKKLWEK
ncbi:MAG TPA: cobalamin biosynthesis protein CobQ [Ruminococcaceae bacterium]|nr:cobalamin biosynthesis protein CobQ [Oscillospiraceae bacterium]